MINLKNVFSKRALEVRFLLAGGLNTLFGLGFFPFLFVILERFEIHYIFILIVSQNISVIFSYITNKFFVFKTMGNYLNEFFKFYFFYFFYFVLNIICLPIMVEYFKFTPIFAHIIFSIFIIVSSFFWHKNISFIKKGIVIHD